MVLPPAVRPVAWEASIISRPQKASQIVAAQLPPSGVPEGTPQSITFDMETPGGAIDPTSHAVVTLSLLASSTRRLDFRISFDVRRQWRRGFHQCDLQRNRQLHAAGQFNRAEFRTHRPVVSVTAGAASTLVITQQPTGAAAGQTIGSAVVEIEDGHGNVITTDTSTVNIAATNGTTLNGTTAVQAVAGVATLSGISINKAGTYTLSMTDGALASVNNSSFVITAGPSKRTGGLAATPGYRHGREIDRISECGCRGRLRQHHHKRFINSDRVSLRHGHPERYALTTRPGRHRGLLAICQSLPPVHIR